MCLSMVCEGEGVGGLSKIKRQDCKTTKMEEGREEGKRGRTELIKICSISLGHLYLYMESKNLKADLGMQGNEKEEKKKKRKRNV